MNALDQIFVSDCVSLGAELARQPWLSEAERIAAAVDVAVTRAVEDAVADKYSQDELDDATNEAEDRTRQDCVAEIDGILDSFDCEADDYGARVVEAINVWIKENS